MIRSSITRNNNVRSSQHSYGHINCEAADGSIDQEFKAREIALLREQFKEHKADGDFPKNARLVLKPRLGKNNLFAHLYHGRMFRNIKLQHAKYIDIYVYLK